MLQLFDIYHIRSTNTLLYELKFDFTLIKHFLEFELIRCMCRPNLVFTM